VIPHGFFNCLPGNGPPAPKIGFVPSAVGFTDNPATGGGLAVVGSNTTWSDMRWLSDLIRMHRSMVSLQFEGVVGQASTLFVAAGTFRPYIRPIDGTCVDELSDLIAEATDAGRECSVELIEGAEIAAACAPGGGVHNQVTLRRWLWQRCGGGARVCVLVSPLPPADDLSPLGVVLAVALLADLIDFNLQLYRELLRDFAPKVLAHSKCCTFEPL
jgi:hypothetical protein